MFQNNNSNFYAFLPMILACEDKYQKLSARGCLLYSLMLSRANLSKKNKNRFSDENGVFIYFSLDEICKYLNCSKPTAINTVQELVSAELVKRGACNKGKTPKYYVKELNPAPCKSSSDKEVSFDVERAERNAYEKPIDFGSMKIKRHRTKTSLPK